VPTVVAEPWGLNFKERTRILITRLRKSDEEIAKEVAAFLEEARSRPSPQFRTGARWSTSLTGSCTAHERTCLKEDFCSRRSQFR